MQKQEQIERQYSFEEICPEWSQILSEQGGYIANKHEYFKNDKGSTRSISECASCIVGEAHS